MKTTTNDLNQPAVSEQDQPPQQNQQIDALTKQNAILLERLNALEEQNRLLKQALFGRSSEKTIPVDPDQLTLDIDFFNEAETIATDEPEQTESEQVAVTSEKKPRKRTIDLDALPQERIEQPVTEEEQVCSCCNGQRHVISEVVHRELVVVPKRMYVRNRITYKMGCRSCEQHGVDSPIVQTQGPNAVIPKSIASAELLALIMIQKYLLALPLYRQEKDFEREGILLSRQTMANWMMYAAQTWLLLIYNRMHEQLRGQSILHADETRVQVLRENGRAAEDQSFMWLYRSGRAENKPIVLYDYQMSRQQVNPATFLNGFSGYLHVDGFAGYHGLKEVKLAGCWAHARRKFDEAIIALPKELKNKPSAAQEGLDYCNQLFSIERRCKDKTAEERYAIRQAKSKPLLEDYLGWLQKQATQITPKSSVGKAVNYCLNQWEKLTTFLEDGRLEIDNNRGERSIKPFVIGRKNWLFSNTPKGADTSAIIYSIIETAKENHLDPQTYLCKLFEQLPNINVQDVTILDQMMPWSTGIQENCKSKKPIPASK